MNSDRTEYQWKFEFTCVLIVVLLIATAFLGMNNSKLKSEIHNLEASMSGLESQAYDEGYDSGYNKGYNIGYDDGLIDGEPNGYDEGYDNGYLYGYAFGIRDGINNADEDMDPYTLEFLLVLTKAQERWKPID